MMLRLSVYFGMIATGVFLVAALVADPPVVHALGYGLGLTMAVDVLAVNVWKAVRR